MTPPRNDRIRIRFAKFGRIRFISHRDVARVWERTLRRARIPVAYSEGFSPRPRLHFGLALATAHESWGEYLDVDLPPGTVLDHNDLPARLGPILPPGMFIQATAEVLPGTDSLQEAVDHCTWIVQVPELDTARAEEFISSALSAEELPVTRTRKGKTVVDDVRPSLRTLRVAGSDELPDVCDWPTAGVLLRIDLGTRPRACRPSELLEAVDPSTSEGRVLRLHQWTIAGDEVSEPVPFARAGSTAVSAAHAMERVP